MPRFFISIPPEDGVFTLTGEDAHHACRVLRLRPGEQVTICDGAGMDYACEVEETTPEAVRCRVQESGPSVAEPKHRLVLYMALPKGDKMEFIVQKSIELGACEVVPYLSAHCVSRPGSTERKVLRWRKIAQEAAKQCGRAILPVVRDVCSFEEILSPAAQADTPLFFYENEKETHLSDALASGTGKTVSLVIGPEGGFSPEEAARAVQAGLRSVSLGPRILRCETAPLTALSAVLYAGGDL